MAKKSADSNASAPRRKRRRVNKSAAIRDYLAANPGASPAEVVAALQAQRIKVTPQFVSTIKSKSNGGTKSSAASNSSANAASSHTSATSPYEQFKKAGELFSEALELVMKAGAKEAQDLVQMAGKMVQRIREKN